MAKFSKYNSKKTVVDGITFDSKKEAVRYGQLKLLKKSGVILDFALQPEFPYMVMCYHPTDIMASYTVKRKYIADFAVTYPDYHVEVEDVKGYATAEFKRKKKIVENVYGIKIKII